MSAAVLRAGIGFGGAKGVTGFGMKGAVEDEDPLCELAVGAFGALEGLGIAHGQATLSHTAPPQSRHSIRCFVVQGTTLESDWHNLQIRPWQAKCGIRLDGSFGDGGAGKGVGGLEGTALGEAGAGGGGGALGFGCAGATTKRLFATGRFDGTVGTGPPAPESAASAGFCGGPSVPELGERYPADRPAC